MPTSTFGLDLTAGSFATVTVGSFNLNQNTGGTYGTTSPAPYAGAGRLGLASGENILVADSSPLLWSAGAGSGGGNNRYVDALFYLPDLVTARSVMGSFYFSTNGIWIEANGSAGVRNNAGTNLGMSSAGLITATTWFRVAWRYEHTDDTTLGEVRFFTGANIFGTTPNHTVPGATLPNEGYAYIGPYMGSGALFVDEVILSTDGWPTRGAPPPTPVPKGWWITKPG